MKRTILAAALLACTALATPASAVVIDATQEGQSTGFVPFNGIVGGNVQAGLTSALNLTLIDVNTATNTWLFGYQLDNTSSAPITASAVSAFGFDTAPDLTSASVTGFFTKVDLGGNISGGNNKLDFCATAGPTCSGGASNGLNINAGIAAGQFTLDFAGSGSQITLDSFLVRYQEIAGSIYGNSGIGAPVGPIQFCATQPCDSPVPGPVVAAGLPGLIAAGGGLFGLNFWRRRRNHGNLPA